MHRRKKLMSTPSCGGVRGVDRFSDLPEGVPHHILSFLTITDVTRFGCVSKRCRQLHLSAPSLKFEGLSFANLSPLDKKLRLIDALDRFMIRREDVKMQTFCFSGFGIFNEYRVIESRVSEWIQKALRCNIEGIHLAFDTVVDLPLLFQTILRCGTLRSLSVEMMSKYKSLTLPSSACFSKIECLKLKNIHVVDEGFFRWISSSCKYIKELHLEGIEGIRHLSIESSSLLSVSVVHQFVLVELIDPLILSISADNLVHLVIDWGFHNCKKVLNITAPELKYLRLEGNSLMHQNLGELRRLEKADLYLRPEGGDINVLPEIISSIRSVKVLSLGHETLKALFQKGSRPEALDNVRHLCMHVGYMLDDTPSMLSILRGIPNLSTLYIKSYPLFKHDASESSGMYRKLLKLAALDQLEEVTIELPNGTNGIELAGYILKHTTSLKKIVIVHSPQQFSVARELPRTYGKTNLRVVLVEDQNRAILKEINRRV